MIAIEATLINRQRMKAARAWRCFLELPDDRILASQLTAYIESQMHVTLVGADGSQVDINPAFIVDVVSKGKRFHLVIETVYEKQSWIGPYLTNMHGDKITVKIAAEHQSTDGEPTPQAKRGDIAPHLLASLHSKWFKNEMFWRYLTNQTHINIADEATCKLVFRSFMKVDTCTELTQAGFDAMLQDFNAYVSQR
jgi:hypothetical protein